MTITTHTSTTIQVGDTFLFSGLKGQDESGEHHLRVEGITMWGTIYYSESPDGDTPFKGGGYQGMMRTIPYDRALILIQERIWVDPDQEALLRRLGKL